MKPTPCVVCGKSTTWAIWGHPVCEEHAADWNTRPEHTAGHVDRVLGVVWDEKGLRRNGKPIDTAELGRISDESFRRLTAKWAASLREKAGAA